MRLLNKMKHIAATTVTILAVSAITTTGLNVQAAEIETTTKTYNYGVYELGDEINVNHATNLKINGKKYTKGSIKKKVKTIQTNKNAYYVDNMAAYTEYQYNDGNHDGINDNIPDTVDYDKQFEEYKRIYMHDFELTFLKTGKYTISYDQYTTGEPKKVKNADGISYTVTPVLKKTTVTESYKVLKSKDVFKSIKLGKTKHTWSTKKAKNGAKTTTKFAIKNRFLTGNGGKLTFKLNDKKTYKFNNALVVTRDANGILSFAVVGNKSKVAYSAGIYSDTTTYDKINQDANGFNVVDPVTKKSIKTTVTTGTKADKYKETTVFYGYQNKFTGDSLSYAVAPTTVYVRRKASSATNAEWVEQEVTNNGITTTEYIYDPVAATVITRTYPEQVAKYDKATATVSYKTVMTVEQMVVLSTDKTMNEGTYYFLDAKGENGANSGNWEVVSKDGIPAKVADTDGLIRDNADYIMAFDFSAYDTCYNGMWIVDNDYKVDYNDFDKSCYTHDALGKSTRWVYKYTYDTMGKRIEVENNNVIYDLGSQLDNKLTFYAK